MAAVTSVVEVPAVITKLAPVAVVLLILGAFMFALTQVDERNAELRKQDFECVRRHGYLATIEPGYQRVCLSELKIMEFNEVWSRVEVK